MTPTIDQLLRARTGPMTSELVQRPAAFGLGNVPARLAPASTTKAVCGFCSTGCSLKVHRDAGGQAVNLTPDPEYPVNLGMACPKGWEALTPLASSDRVTAPLLRNPATGRLEPVGWERALNVFVERMRGAREKHGPDAVAVLSTGQICTEEMALLGALAKFGMGIRHVDSNTRQCMATAQVAYKQSFGFDAPPYTYADFEEGDALFFFGANPAIAHPILWQRVQRNRRKPRIVVIDPRRTETAMAATDHIAVNPRCDLWLLYGISHAIVAGGWARAEFLDAHTSGFAEYASFLVAYSPERCAEHCGVSAEKIRELARLVHDAPAASFWWTMGVNQGHQSTRTAQAIINLALLSGHIGRPGTGPNSITGQCNAMGSRLFANATSLFGGRDFLSAAHRTEVARILGIPPERIPADTSWAYDQILDGIDTGAVRALWVVATNPAHSWIDQGSFHERRRKLDFLVVQDMYATTETARTADLVLPAAGWGEKEGTFINSERRIGLVRKVSRAPGEALTDFTIFRLIADSWGCGEMFRSWDTPKSVFQILKALSAGRPCDMTGIEDYEHLESAGGIQWPWSASDAECRPSSSPIGAATGAAAPADAGGEIARRDSRHPPVEGRLFADGAFFTPDRRAKFLFEAPVPMPEPPDGAFPFLLNTGRGSSAQWHTGTRTGKSEILRKLAPQAPYVEMNPEDAARLGLSDHARVLVRTRRGSAAARAFLTATVSPGQIFMPMHFPEVNRLTFPAFDPHSRQPAYKACAATVEPR